MQNADGSRYAAGGIACFNLPNGTLKWHTAFDLSFADRALLPLRTSISSHCPFPFPISFPYIFPFPF
jgi:hypothetical protein